MGLRDVMTFICRFCRLFSIQFSLIIGKGKQDTVLPLHTTTQRQASSTYSKPFSSFSDTASPFSQSISSEQQSGNDEDHGLDEWQPWTQEGQIQTQQQSTHHHAQYAASDKKKDEDAAAAALQRIEQRKIESLFAELAPKIEAAPQLHVRPVTNRSGLPPAPAPAPARLQLDDSYNAGVELDEWVDDDEEGAWDEADSLDLQEIEVAVKQRQKDEREKKRLERLQKRMDSQAQKKGLGTTKCD
eukprot:m.21030 g.21030  ORF g.21030 m.21030 type:complete len:243 (-) comp8236_c1_seq2:513-1241(-)